jgi:hypothetical protein
VAPPDGVEGESECESAVRQIALLQLAGTCRPARSPQMDSLSLGQMSSLTIVYRCRCTQPALRRASPGELQYRECRSLQAVALPHRGDRRAARHIGSRSSRPNPAFPVETVSVTQAQQILAAGLESDAHVAFAMAVV